MNNFTNETIDTIQLPKFEAVTYTKLHAKYWKVILVNIAIVFIIIGIVALLATTYIDELFNLQIEISVSIIVLLILVLLFSRIGFKKKGFAFRNHDVLFQYGVIATNTIVIPYNRVQHVALHESLVSRYFGLAKIEIFTAGGGSSDINIPGIEKKQAEQIKQLLTGKIQKEL